MKAGHPDLQATVVGVDVLDMESALACALAGVAMHDLVGDALGPDRPG